MLLVSTPGQSSGLLCNKCSTLMHKHAVQTVYARLHIGQFFTVGDHGSRRVDEQ
jgi:hypothetical protein